MTVHITGQIALKDWDEKSYDEIDDASKLTRAAVTNVYSGDIEGEAKLEYLMYYREATHASFVGLERVVGRIGDKAGSFVLQHVGLFHGSKSQTTLLILPGSGTDGLHGLRGHGKVIWAGVQGTPSEFALELDFE